jgi:hypothetical protein
VPLAELKLIVASGLTVIVIGSVTNGLGLAQLALEVNSSLIISPSCNEFEEYDDKFDPTLTKEAPPFVLSCH